MRTLFNAPQRHWDARNVKEQFDCIESEEEQLLFLMEVEDAIAEIEDDIQTARYDPPDGLDMMYYEDIPEIEYFCRRKRDLILKRRKLHHDHDGTVENDIPADVLLKLKGDRLSWIGNRDDLSFLFENLADAGLIPAEQKVLEVQLQHFWLSLTKPDQQVNLYANKELTSSPIFWTGDVVAFAYLLWELQGKFLDFEWKDLKTVLRHFSRVNTEIPIAFNHKTMKVYISRFRKEDEVNIRERNESISPIVDALNKRLREELHR